MLVKTQCKGHEYLGVEVGTTDVRRYFPKQIRVIEIELDHLQIQCGLTPGFWNGHPEISDRRLCAWLESKNFHGKLGERPVQLALIPSGRNCFRLQAMPMGAHSAQSRNKHAAASTPPA
jgi:hypothetical protein